MQDNNSILKEKELLRKLQEILLTEDRDALAQVRNTLHDPIWFRTNANPVIEEHIEYLKQNFPKEFNKSVEKIVDRRLKASQAEILDTIYPVLGTMIKKYINYQFQTLKDAIDQKVKELSDTKNLWRRIKASIFGIKSTDIILSDMGKPIMEEVFVIQRDSGLLIGSASLRNTIQKDAVAGMLTAIKAFVEDAFQREKEELELISYASYKILLHNYHSYYLAVALSGSISLEEHENLRNQLQDFSRQYLVGYQYGSLDELSDEVSRQLEAFFMQQQR
jgi:hypothetical protein